MIQSTGAVTNRLSLSAVSAGAGKGGGQLGESDFLQLLVTQLRYQDPMQPMDDKQFIAQLAQFSALEQAQAQTRWSQMTFGLGLVGRTIDYTGSDGQARSAVVKAVRLVQGNPVLSLGDSDVTIDQVISAS